MLTSGVVLIDLDRTLLNEHYQLTDPGINDAIAQAKANGLQVGLNSDTPFASLYMWWNQLKMNGPIIYEKGAGIWFPEDDADICLTGASMIVQRARPILISHLIRKERVMLVYGDAVNFVRQISAIPNSCDRIFIGFNGLRRYSIAFHIRRIDEHSGSLVIDTDTAQRILNSLEDYLPVSELLSAGHYDMEYGFFYINPTDVNKATGAKEAFRRLTSSRQIVIGDSMSDYPGEDQSDVEVCAVANATDHFREIASKVAEGSYTQGVTELLRSL